MDDYERIARVIAYLDARQSEQPDLATLAREVGLSPHHFHRLFVQWAGVTPKDFLQCLTVEHAKSLLRRGASVLDATFESGLSGPGRLHDLCVTLEAASPGEIKRGGEGWTLIYGIAASPLGRCLLAHGPRGFCVVSFIDPVSEEEALSQARQEWPRARWQRDDDTAARWSRQLFREPGQSSSPATIKTFVRGTPFQVRVWQALLRLPPGVLVTYGQLAAAVGTPKASRAVGSAVGSNPLSVLIPCHRVIRSTGIIGEYRWGSLRKRALIARETVRAC